MSNTIDRKDAAEFKMFNAISKKEPPSKGRPAGTAPGRHTNVATSLEPLIKKHLEFLENAGKSGQKKALNFKEATTALFTTLREVADPMEQVLSRPIIEDGKVVKDIEGREEKRTYVTEKEVLTWNLKPETLKWLKANKLFHRDGLSGENHLHKDTLLWFATNQVMALCKF